MALNLAAASSQSLTVDSTPVTAAPFTVACWFLVNDVDNIYDLFSIVDKDVSNNHFWELRVLGTTTDVLSWRAFVSSQANATTSTAVTAGVWHHAVAIEAADNDRSVYLNGGGVGTNSTSRAPLNADRIAIGVQGDASPVNYMDGMIAEVAIWNVALTAAEVACLAKGIRADKIRPDNLVFYNRAIRNLTADLVGGLTLTNNNGATVGAHPRIIEDLEFGFISPSDPPIGGSIFEESLSNDIAFDNTSSGTKVDSESASNDIAFDSTVSGIVVRNASSSSDIAFDSSGSYDQFVIGTNDITFDSTVSTTRVRYRTPNNSILFNAEKVEGYILNLIQEVNNNVSFDVQSASTIKNGVASNNILFNSSVIEQPESDITFSSSVQPRLIITVNVANSLSLEQHVGKAIVGTASNDIAFTSLAAKGGEVLDTLTFENTVSALIGNSGENDVLFNSSVLFGGVFTKSLSNDVSFTNQVVGRKVVICLDGFNPHNSEYSGDLVQPTSVGTSASSGSVTFFDSVHGTLILDSAEFGDEFELAVGRVENYTRTGEFRVKLRTNFGKKHRFTFELVLKSKTQRDNLLAFVKNTLSKRIDLTFHDGRLFKGVIINPTTGFSTIRDECLYNVTFDFVGDLI